MTLEYFQNWHEGRHTDVPCAVQRGELHRSSRLEDLTEYQKMNARILFGLAPSQYCSASQTTVPRLDY